MRLVDGKTGGPRLSEGFSAPPPEAISARQMWANNRFWMETQNLVTKRYGGKRKQHWYALLVMMKTFEWGLKRCRPVRARRAQRRATSSCASSSSPSPTCRRASTASPSCTSRTRTSTACPESRTASSSWCAGREFDLCVLTGDYRTELHGPIRAVMASLQRLVAGIDSREGFLGVLGNHDDCHMVAPMEAMGIRMLINESVVLTRGGDRLRIVGTDDVHYYYTDQSLHALEAARDDFTIALVHSPELFDAAAEAGVDLYLCGHTHGGQVCLPGGIAPVKHLRAGRHLFRGHWRHGGMQGITNAGAGTSGIPVRFNTESEILALRLRRGWEVRDVRAGMKAAWYERQGPRRRSAGGRRDAGPGRRAGRGAHPRPGVGHQPRRPQEARRAGSARACPTPRVIPHSDGAGEIDRVGEGVTGARSASGSGATGPSPIGRSARPPSSCRPRRAGGAPARRR